jgi:hypothetical protein
MKTQAPRAQNSVPNKAKHELLLGMGEFVGFLALSALLLTAFNPGLRASLAGSLLAPKAQGSVELVVVHTNDTWGYTKPCG